MMKIGEWQESGVSTAVGSVYDALRQTNVGQYRTARTARVPGGTLVEAYTTDDYGVESGHALAFVPDAPEPREPGRPDGCEGKGRCHGAMQWCDACGDVSDVCDASDCAAHKRGEWAPDPADPGEADGDHESALASAYGPEDDGAERG